MVPSFPVLEELIPKIDDLLTTGFRQSRDDVQVHGVETIRSIQKSVDHLNQIDRHCLLTFLRWFYQVLEVVGSEIDSAPEAKRISGD